VNLPATARSLSEVHSSIEVPDLSLWRRMFAFAGPAYLVSVGYMDPGNWATDLEGGARFGYQLLWVLVMSNAMAILLQTLSARLGIVSGKDLAQACREHYPQAVGFALWAISEVAIAACDLAEVLGTAIGLQLLFGIPLITGVLITALDALLVLWLQRFGMRVLEAFILSLITVIGVCFLIEIVLAKPGLKEMAGGLVPRLNGESLYVAISILGATVMPHNLYLHSALVQTRRIDSSEKAKQAACRYNLVDSVVALNAALLVNAAILVMSAAVFFSRGIAVREIQQAHKLLEPLLGTTLASGAFAIALIASGQSSTITGTMAGQIVMEGFLSIRMRPWVRRLVTRALAITPAALVIGFAGEGATLKLLLLSQVILSLQLPFAVIPLIHFTSDRSRMGGFANRNWVKLLAWAAAAIIVGLNVQLVWTTLAGWVSTSGRWSPAIEFGVIPAVAALGLLLVWVTAEPWIRRQAPRREAVTMPAIEAGAREPAYQRILVTLDHSALDRQAIAHAAAIARTGAARGARIYLVHVEEGAPSRLYGNLASDAEVRAGEDYLESVRRTLEAQGIPTEGFIAHSSNPGEEIVRVAREVGADLLVMGAHGHRKLKDFLLGDTIEPVRHALDTPILIVRQSPK
jgi:manganese transport protein